MRLKNLLAIRWGVEFTLFVQNTLRQLVHIPIKFLFIILTSTIKIYFLIANK